MDSHWIVTERLWNNVQLLFGFLLLALTTDASDRIISCPEEIMFLIFFVELICQREYLDIKLMNFHEIFGRSMPWDIGQLITF